MSIGRADFINAVEGKPDARVTMANGQLGYSRGGFSHIVRTTNDMPFYNITVELLHPQPNIHSDCAKTLSGPLEGCSTPQETVRESAHDTNAELTGGVKSGASPGEGGDTPLAQSEADDAKKTAPAAPPAFTTIFESDESALKSGAFAARGTTSLQAPASGSSAGGRAAFAVQTGICRRFVEIIERRGLPVARGRLVDQSDEQF